MILMPIEAGLRSAGSEREVAAASVYTNEGAA
jgi:hypothetical protein